MPPRSRDVCQSPANGRASAEHRGSAAKRDSTKKSPPWTPTYKIPRFVSCIRLLDRAADDVVVAHGPCRSMMPAARAVRNSHRRRRTRERRARRRSSANSLAVSFGSPALTLATQRQNAVDVRPTMSRRSRWWRGGATPDVHLRKLGRHASDGMEPVGHPSERCCATRGDTRESLRRTAGDGRCRCSGAFERKPKKASSDSADGEARSNTADQLRSATQ